MKYRKGKNPNSLKNLEKGWGILKGRSYEEAYGLKATKIIEKLSEAHKGIDNWHHDERDEERKNKIRQKRLKQILPSKDTVIEVMIQKELDKRGIDYKKHLPIYGVQPDLVFPERKIIVFLDGDYWHSKSFDNGNRWKKDRMVDHLFELNNWTVLRFWEHEIKEDLEKCINHICDNLRPSMWFDVGDISAWARADQHYRDTKGAQ